jgi:hypothetical protein
VKFGRRSSPAEDIPVDDGADEQETTSDPVPLARGPHDIDDVDVENDGVERVDLGGMLIAPADGLELRVQVDEVTTQVQSVMMAGPDGAVELRPFAASRGGDMWDDVRRQIAADTAQRGGTASEREGTWGTELTCQVQVTTPEGRVGRQESRVVGVQGPRWLLRATFLGKPATSPETAGRYEDVVSAVVVRRGTVAMAPGDPIPLTLPPTARRI